MSEDRSRQDTQRSRTDIALLVAMVQIRGGQIDLMGTTIVHGNVLADGVILTSPNGTQYLLGVDDAGALTITAV